MNHLHNVTVVKSFIMIRQILNPSSVRIHTEKDTNAQYVNKFFTHQEYVRQFADTECLILGSY